MPESDPLTNPYTDFSVHVAPHAEGGIDVTIFGELDLATVEQVEDALGQAIDGEGDVVIDMRACGFVDSRGIAALVRAALRLREQGRQVLIRGVQQRVMRTLERAGITTMDHLRIEPQEPSRQA